MKKVLSIVIALFLCNMAVFSQDAENGKPEAANEVKLNLLMTVLKVPEITYERIFPSNLGVGLSAAVALDNDVFDFNYLITPYTRFYFGSRFARGFFIEANMAFMEIKEEYYSYGGYGGDYYGYYKNNFVFGLGFALGGKFVNKNGFVGEFFFGCGNSFDSNDHIYPRMGVSIGKQF